MNLRAVLGSAAAQEDLGGGFVYVRREDGASIIIASSFSEAGVFSATMPAPADARLDADVAEWLKAWHLDLDGGLRAVDQAHGETVLPASAAAAGSDVPRADGMFTGSPDDLLIIRSADCAPIWIADADAGLLAMLHAGWRGVATGIVAAGVRALREAGAGTAKMRVAIGPHLRPSCFEIGPEVAALFEQSKGAVLPPETLIVPRQRRDSVALDLAAIIVGTLVGEGIPPHQIAIATACTRCRADILHSYRRNGPGGPLMASFGQLSVD